MPQTVYAMCGLAFSGKSSAARIVAGELGAELISLDAINAERGLSGGTAGAGRPVSRPAPVVPRSHEKDRTVYQNKVQSFVANSLEMTAQAVLSADRRSVRVSLTPVVCTASSKPVQVVSPVFPGGPGR